MIVENTRQDQIKNIIIKVANATHGIKQEHIRKAIVRYINDERDLAIIEQELWAYSKEIEEAARLQEQTVNNREENVNKNQDSTQKTSQVDKEERESYPMSERQDVSENVNLQDSTQRTNDELADMFTNEPAQAEPTRTYQQQAEKGRVLVKTPTSNNRGQATFLNLCFIFSTIAILGMIISTIILYTQKLFN